MNNERCPRCERLYKYLESFQEDSVDWYLEEEGADAVDLAINVLVSYTAQLAFYKRKLKALEAENEDGF
jgi:hypothetical protein